MKLGIVGLPNVGVVSVPDARLQCLSDFYTPKKTTPAVIEFVEIAGLVKGASKGEGLGNKFLSNIRTTDAIVHVVRCFEDSNVTHVKGNTDPLRDIDIINMELVMADIEMVERRIDKAQKACKGGDKKFVHEVDLFTELLAHLNEGKLARTFDCSEDDKALIATSDLLTLKKTIYVGNLAENEINEPENNHHYMAVKALAQEEGSQLLPICAKLEADIAELDDPDEKAILVDLADFDWNEVVIDQGVEVSFIDTATEDYDCSDGYGNVTLSVSSQGTVVPLVNTKDYISGIQRYVALEDNGSYSFHRYYAAITSVSLKPSSAAFGYKDISTTMNIYSHVLPSVAKEAAQKIGALVYEAG